MSVQRDCFNFHSKEITTFIFERKLDCLGPKLRTIIDLSKVFVDGKLSESMLKTGLQKYIIDALLQMKGIGPLVQLICF